MIRPLLLAALLGLPACSRSPAPAYGAHLAVEQQRFVAEEPSASFAVAGVLAESQALPLGATTLALLDYPQSRVVLLDVRDGTLRSVGRRGGGPGEFENPRFLVRTAHGFGVYDDAKLALVTFDSAGAPQPEISSYRLTGSVAGILTGIAQVTDGWVYSVREPPPIGPREALYVYRGGTARLLGATAVPVLRPLRTGCGISLSPQPPVFWPTLRWAATADQVAFATSVDDRVTLWSAATGDTVVLSGPAEPVRATREMAESLSLGLRVSTGRKECALSGSEALEQRGMESLRPVIGRLALAPDGSLWLEVQRDGRPPLWRVHRSAGLPDTLTAPSFPGLFLSDSLFVAEEGSSAGAALSLWAVQSRR